MINSKITNDHQKKALRYVIVHGEISNRQYQELNYVSNKTALRDLNALVSIGALRRVGIGKSIVYKK